MAKNRLSLDELKAGGKYFVGSLLAEVLIFAPKKELSLGGRTLAVMGLFPMTQKYLASGAQKVLDDAVPGAADRLTGLLGKTGLEPFVKEKILWLLYDFLGQYSLNNLVTRVFDKQSVLDKNKFSAALRDYLNGVLENKDDRAEFIDNLTKGIMNSIDTIADGTILSYVLNDSIVAMVTETVTTIVDHILTSDLGDLLVDKLLETVSQFEGLTVPSLLETRMGLGKEQMEELIDRTYDRYLGKGVAQNMRDKNLGAHAYFNLANLDYDKFFDDLIHNHVDDLIRVAVLAASAAIFMMDKTDSVSERAAKAREFGRRISGFGSTRASRREARKAVKSLLQDPDAPESHKN